MSERHLFDIPDEVAYLNCAYLGPQLRAVTEAGLAALRRKAAPWTIVAEDFFDDAERVRGLFAQVLGADSDGVALIPSVSYGVGTAAANLKLGPSRGVLVLAEDFPSDVYPWRAAAAESGATVTTVPRSADWTDAVLERLDASVGVVAVPQCHWTDGSPVDLVAVGERAREVGAALVVDASQSLGASRFDVAAIQPDFVIAVGYKWLLGPYGMGYLWVAPQHRDGRPLEYGWLPRARSEDFARLVEYTDEWKPGARRFDVGERSNLILLPMAAAALRQILDWGVDRIASAAGELTAYAGKLAEQAGLTVGPHAPHIVGLRFPDGVPDGLTARLGEAGVYVSVRGDSVRVSPNVYNSREDVDRLFGALG